MRSGGLQRHCNMEFIGVMNLSAFAFIIASFLSVAVSSAGYAAKVNGGVTGEAIGLAPSAQTVPGKLERKFTTAELAARGDSQAQFQMGELAIPKRGPGGAKAQKATKEALVWFTLAGKNGNVQGAVSAAKIYESMGLLRDAARWWYQAGLLGDGGARNRFVDIFLKGKAYGIEGQEGVTWLSERALTTRTPAIKMALGSAFEYGWGTVPNLDEAQRWYLDAALDWNAPAMVSLGNLELHLPALWRSPDTETDSEGHWTGAIFYPLRPYSYDDTGSLDYGRQSLAQEKKIDADHLIFDRPGMTDGEYWLKRAARMGSPNAKAVLGLAKLDGTTLPLDIPTGYWLLNSAACSLNHEALMKLGHRWMTANPLRSWVFFEVAVRNGQSVEQDDWDRLTKALTPRQINRAKQIAQDWCAQY